MELHLSCINPSICTELAAQGLFLSVHFNVLTMEYIASELILQHHIKKWRSTFHKYTVCIEKYLLIYLGWRCNKTLFLYFMGFNGLIPITLKQGKSEGFESCDWPIVRKRPIWVKFGDALYRVTLKFDEWPWKTIGHLSFAVSSFVQHFIAIGEFKLELQSGNAQSRSNSTIFIAVWPWNLTDDLEKQ